jgi:stage III sporulation protein AF
METIRQLVRNLALLAILATFLEMLLPLQGTRRFVQVTIGLFILLAVLGPIVSLFRQQPPLHFDLPVNSPGPDLKSILEQGQSIEEASSAQEQATYVQRLEDQIEVMCRLVPGVKAAKATVVLSPDASLRSLGTVQKVAVELQPGEIQSGEPQSGEPQSGEPQSGEQQAGGEEIANQVQETVASLFGLQKEQVSVNFVNAR